MVGRRAGHRRELGEERGEGEEPKEHNTNKETMPEPGAALRTSTGGTTAAQPSDVSPSGLPVSPQPIRAALAMGSGGQQRMVPDEEWMTTGEPRGSSDGHGYRPV